VKHGRQPRTAPGNWLACGDGGFGLGLVLGRYCA
jgi:hypothetical protein